MYVALLGRIGMQQRSRPSRGAPSASGSQTFARQRRSGSQQELWCRFTSSRLFEIPVLLAY